MLWLLRLCKHGRLEKQNLLRLPPLTLERGASPADPSGPGASGAADLLRRHSAAEGAAAAFSAALLAAIFCAKMLFLPDPTFTCKQGSHVSPLSRLPRTPATNKHIDLSLTTPSDRTSGCDTEKLLAATCPFLCLCYSFFNTQFNASTQRQKHECFCYLEKEDD